MLMTVCLALSASASAQTWNKWDTRSTISGVLGIANAAIESAERKKEMEILARQKAEYEQSFKDAMTEAKAFETAENWEEALEKYEEAAQLNCKYGYSDQRTLSKKITNLYVKAKREEDGPSVLNNSRVTLADYSGYRYVRENPVYVNKKATNTKILRVACSNRETRIEMECEATAPNTTYYMSGATYIKGNKGSKLSIASVENITLTPAKTYIPWPYQKLRFALIFPALPEDAEEFDLIEPSTTWKFKDIKCK